MITSDRHTTGGGRMAGGLGAVAALLVLVAMLPASVVTEGEGAVRRVEVTSVGGLMVVWGEAPAERPAEVLGEGDCGAETGGVGGSGWAGRAEVGIAWGGGAAWGLLDLPPPPPALA